MKRLKNPARRTKKTSRNLDVTILEPEYGVRLGSPKETVVRRFANVGSMRSIVPVLKGLAVEERKTIYVSREGIEVVVTRTGKLGPQDFVVGLKSPGRNEFNPTHIRLLIDLFLKRHSDNWKFRHLFAALDDVYNGADPAVCDRAFGLSFPMFLDSCEVTLYYCQLLMLEQDFNYTWPREGKTWKYGREFLKGFINWVESGEETIDKIVTNAVRNWPPPPRFVPEFLGNIQYAYLVDSHNY
ncbi:MAG: hypothetical protein AB1603_03985 [Chloroflexota bacterium]